MGIKSYYFSKKIKKNFTLSMNTNYIIIPCILKQNEEKPA